MKLSKLYANKKFKTIVFTEGLNAVFADVKSKEKDTSNFTHNLGKSKLVEVIDFLLLKRIGNKHWLTSIQDANGQLLFKDYEFFLEIELNSGNFLTIKRSVEKYRMVCFYLSSEKNKDLTVFSNWTHLNIPIEKEINKVKTSPARDLLQNFLNISIGEPIPYRKALGYSLREQVDYNHVFKLNKFQGPDIDWKPFLFSLLGFNGEVLADKYSNEKRIKDIEKAIREHESDFGVEATQKDKIVGELQIKKLEFNEISKQLEDLNLFQQDKQLIANLVDTVEVEISVLNKLAYTLSFDIKKIEQSIESEFSFDMDAIKQLFSETEIYFSDNLKKSYDDLVVFNKQITTERNKLLKENLIKKKDELNAVNIKLRELHSQLEQHKQVIQESSTFSKMKHYQRELLKLEGDIVRLQSKLDATDIISIKSREKKTILDEVDDLIEKIQNAVENTLENQKYTSIRNTFSYLIKKILNATGILSVQVNRNNNIEFDCSIEKTAQASGFTFNKLICVAFDLAILINYSNESYLKFVYHDDVFSNQENRLRRQLVEVIREVTAQHGIQYIFSIIKDDLPVGDNGNKIEFASEEIVLNLHDRDDSGKLFEMKF